MEPGGHPGLLARMRRHARIPAAGLLLGVLGCFSYVPAPAPPRERGAEVRVVFREPVELRLVDVTANVIEVRGELVSAAPDELVLSVFGAISARDREWRGVGETLHVSRANVALLERRRFDVIRTAGLVALIVAGTLATSQVIGIGGGGGGDGNGGRTQ